MPLETTLRPRGPYSLEASSRRGGDATRQYRDGFLTLAYEAADAPTLARVWQWRDGRVGVRIETTGDAAAASDRLRFLLAVDDDHTDFLRRFGRDRLLADVIRRSPGFRPLRTGTTTHAVLKAVCGQLIQARAARLLENRLLRYACPEHRGFPLPPRREAFARHAPAELVRRGLAARKASALVRISREVDLEKLHATATCDAVARIVRERGLGPWSAGMICLHGLGRYEHGLVGDLGLVKLCGSLLGRRADADDTAELLARYGEWAGLASLYLLAIPPARGLSARAAYVPDRAQAHVHGGGHVAVRS